MGRWKCADPEPAWEMTANGKIILSLNPPKYDFHEQIGLPTGMAEATDVYGSIISFPANSLLVIQVAATKMAKGKEIIWMKHPKHAEWINEQWVFSPTILRMAKYQENYQDILKENNCYIYQRWK